MTDPTTRAEEGANAAWERAADFVRLRASLDAAESRAASAEAEVEKLKARVEALTDALEPLWQRARTPGADAVTDDGWVTVFMLDCRIAARAALKESTHV